MVDIHTSLKLCGKALLLLLYTNVTQHFSIVKSCPISLQNWIHVQDLFCKSGHMQRGSTTSSGDALTIL